jgi:hypothetical protein
MRSPSFSRRRKSNLVVDRQVNRTTNGIMRNPRHLKNLLIHTLQRIQDKFSHLNLISYDLKKGSEYFFDPELISHYFFFHRFPILHS